MLAPLVLESDLSRRLQNVIIFVTVFQAPWYVGNHTPPITWPQHGAIEFLNYSTRYRPGFDLVLRGITARIMPKEKVFYVDHATMKNGFLAEALHLSTLVVDNVCRLLCT